METIDYSHYSQKTFSTISDLVNEVLARDTMKDDITIVTTSEYVSEIFTRLLMQGHMKMRYINFDSTDYSGEYYISVYNDELYIEMAWHEKNEYYPAGYFTSESDVTYVHNVCDSEILNHIGEGKIAIFAFKDNEKE